MRALAAAAAESEPAQTGPYFPIAPTPPKPISLTFSCVLPSVRYLMMLGGDRRQDERFFRDDNWSFALAGATAFDPLRIGRERAPCGVSLFKGCEAHHVRDIRSVAELASH